MPFFHGSSDFTVANSSLFEIGGDFLNINLTTQDPAAFSAQLLGKGKERGSCNFDAADDLRKRYRYNSRNSDGLMIVNTDEIELRTELISRDSYRIHSASYGAQGRVVAVKLFEGPYAKQDWIKNIAFLRKFFHSNMPKIVGISGESSEVPFIVLHGISEKRIQSLIAKALRTDLNKSIELSMKAVKGLAAGLNYINSQIVLKQLINGRGWENFDIFAGDNEEPIIAISLPSTPCEDDMALNSFDVQSDDHDLEAFNGLCQKLFSEVNSVLYDDSPQREWDTYDAEGLPAASIKEVSEGALNISENEATSIVTPLNSTKSPKLNRTPRREVWWRLDKGKNNRSLDTIARRFGDYLDCFPSSSSDPLLRRIKVSKNAYSSRQTYHQCPGYLREEITLTPDVSRSAIIAHEYPSQSELCSVCGQVVDFKDVLSYRHTSSVSDVLSPIPPHPTNLPTIKFDHNNSYSQFMNHSPHRVIWNGRLYPTALHLHEALKFLDHRPDIAEQIRRCANIHEVYPLSAKYMEFQRPDWGGQFLLLMEEVLYTKFRQHPDLRIMLLGTGTADLEYASPFDEYWGSGADGLGSNQLGIALTRVREQLRED